MKLLTQALLKKLPKLYSQEQVADPIVVCKFFLPEGNFTWYCLEFDGVDTFFGLVVGHDTELGYFSLAELQSLRTRFGLPVERDLWFEPTPLSVARSL